MDAMPVVRHFRQILIGALQLAPLPASSGIQHPWDFLAQADSPWQEVEDEFTADPREFSERHYFDRDTGILGQFRHQLFLLGLIAHFHKAALLVMSDHLSAAVNRLDPTSTDSVRLFQRAVRHEQEVFLRFNHRYWFNEITNQLHARDLYKLWITHLGNDALFSEVRQEVNDINQYLDSARAKKLARHRRATRRGGDLRLRRRIRDRIFGHECVCPRRRFSRDENGGVNRRVHFHDRAYALHAQHFEGAREFLGRAFQRTPDLATEIRCAARGMAQAIDIGGGSPMRLPRTPSPRELEAGVGIEPADDHLARAPRCLTARALTPVALASDTTEKQRWP